MPDPRVTTVSVRDLTKRYGAIVAVRGVSFEVAPGEIFGLLGPNGAGKTTTLECLLGLRRPDAGTLTLNGIDAVSESAAAKQLVGAQLQSAALQDKITPREAMGLFGSFYPRPVPVAALLERFALEDQADRPFDSLSGGQKQRVFLALAFVNDPQLVVLDEPTAGLDPASRRELHRVIAGMRTAGRSVLLSTHDLDEAEQLCDRIGILDRGRMVAIATPAALVAGARSIPRILVKTRQPVPADAVASLAAVVGHEFTDGRWQLRTDDVGATITSLMKELETSGTDLLDLQVQRPSLEDVFLELTGRAWGPPDPEVGP